jgi:hypothetical protein
MSLPPARDLAQRKRDTLAKLAKPAEDVWVATASTGPGGPEPHLVPLSLCWTADGIVLAVASDSATARNVRAHGIARLALGPTRDVVVIDTEFEREVPVDEAGATELADAYATQADWDPREDPDTYVFLVLRPTRVQAWRESNELRGRVLMRDGAWLV